MKKAAEFLKDAGTFYLATAEGSQPRVRPFGAVFEYDGKLYITTGKTKKCFEQMQKNPKVEICAMNKKNEWIRITGEVANDDRREVKEEALKTNPVLKPMYTVDDDVFTTLYFTKGTAVIYSETNEPETFSL